MRTYGYIAILVAHNNHMKAFLQLQGKCLPKIDIQRWLKKWKIKANKTKSMQLTFTIRREMRNLERFNDLESFKLKIPNI